MRRIPKFPSFKRNITQIRHVSNAPIVQITNGIFYRQYPSSLTNDTSNPPIFPSLDFEIPSFSEQPKHWAIIGPSSSGKTTFLEILRGQHICLPPTARSFPYLASEDISRKDQRLRLPSRALQYVGFDAKRRTGVGLGSRGAYLSARYESRREESDFSLLDYLKGNTTLNPLESSEAGDLENETSSTVQRIVEDLKLQDLVDIPLGNLSNGQMRRAMIAKALMGMPEVLLLDQPFMGLDPLTLATLSLILRSLAETNSPRLVLALRPQDLLPGWITHITLLGPGCKLEFSGCRNSVPKHLSGFIRGDGVSQIGRDSLPLNKHIFEKTPILKQEESTLPVAGNEEIVLSTSEDSKSMHLAADRVFLSEEPENSLKLGTTPSALSDASVPGEPLIEMEGVHVKYGQKEILGAWNQDAQGQSQRGLWWTVRKGERWGIFGPNGSGKTTLISLISSDHPQSYSLPIKFFGQSRLPQAGLLGISVFDIQARIGHSSPEIHTVFPRNLTLRQTLENAWADTFFARPPLCFERDAAVDACLRWFKPELDPSAISTDHLDQIQHITPTDATNSSNIRAKKELAVPSKRKGRRLELYQEYIDADTDWADEIYFGDVPFSSQRVALFLRAIVKSPDLVILDEAFSGMDERVRDKCLVFLTWGERRFKPDVIKSSVGRTRRKKSLLFQTGIEEFGSVVMPGLTQDQALICVSHVKEEVPEIVRNWMCLPEPSGGQPVRFGQLDVPLANDSSQWDVVWGMESCT